MELSPPSLACSLLLSVKWRCLHSARTWPPLLSDGHILPYVGSAGHRSGGQASPRPSSLSVSPSPEAPASFPT